MQSAAVYKQYTRILFDVYFNAWHFLNHVSFIILFISFSWTACCCYVIILHSTAKKKENTICLFGPRVVFFVFSRLKASTRNLLIAPPLFRCHLSDISFQPERVKSGTCFLQNAAQPIFFFLPLLYSWPQMAPVSSEFLYFTMTF